MIYFIYPKRQGKGALPSPPFAVTQHPKAWVFANFWKRGTLGIVFVSCHFSLGVNTIPQCRQASAQALWLKMGTEMNHIKCSQQLTDRQFGMLLAVSPTELLTLSEHLPWLPPTSCTGGPQCDHPRTGELFPYQVCAC